MIDATTVYFLSTQTPGQICTEAPPTVSLGDKKSLLSYIILINIFIVNLTMTPLK